MPGAFLMTIKARVVASAAWEFNSQDVEDGMVMFTPCQAVNGLAVDQASADGYEASQGLRFQVSSIH